MAADNDRIEKLEKEIKVLKEKLDRYRDSSDDDSIDKANEKIEHSERVASSVEKLVTTVGNVFSTLNQWVGKAWGEADDAASKYAKTIGSSAHAMETLRKNTINFVNDNSIGIRFNTSMKELLQLQQAYNSQLGRSVTLTNLQLENMAAMRSMIGDEQTVKFTANFEKFGLDANAAADMFTEMFNGAASKGIVLEKYSKNLLDNIDLAQRYTFQDGIDGLKRMAEQATALKWDMQQTASFAEKVNTVEGSIKTGAKLSVLGGPFARFSNPMGMLYESLNDMEGLQDRLIQMFGSLGKWDSNKQQMEISAYNRQRIRTAAEAMGISYEKAIESINAQGRRNEVNKQLGRRDDLSEEVREYVLNSAQIDRKTGRAYVTINGKQKSIDNVTNNDLAALQNMNKSQAEDIKDIAQMLRGYTDIMQGRDKQLQAITAKYQEDTGIGNLTKSINDKVGKTNLLLQSILSVVTTLGTLSAASSLRGAFRGTKGAFSSGGGKKPGGGGAKGATSSAGGSGVVNSKLSKKELNYKIQQNKSFKEALKTETDPLRRYQLESLKRENERAISAHKNRLRQLELERKPKVSGNVKPSARGMVGRTMKSPGFAIAASMGGTLAAQQLYKMSNGRESSGWNIFGDATSFGAQGAAFGAAFGPWGALAGAILGTVGGGIKGAIEAVTEKKKDELAKKGIFLNGDYGIGELSAISNGKIAINSISGLRDKMKNNGDYHIYENSKLAKGGVIVGKSHENGGVAVGKSGIEVEGGEFVVNKEATKKHFGTLSAINQDSIKPIEPMGKQMVVKEGVGSNSISERLDISPFDLNLNGTLKLDLGGQQTQIDARQLLNNSEFIRQLTNTLTKEINIRDNLRFNKSNYIRKL